MDTPRKTFGLLIILSGFVCASAFAVGKLSDCLLWPDVVVNPLINPDFEAGLVGWGSWNGGQALAVEDTNTAASGLQSVRLIASATTTPLLYNDPHATVTPAPVTLVSLGLIRLATDQTYTLSAWLKSNRPQERALLGLASAHAKHPFEVVAVSTEWQREQVTLSPGTPYGFVYIQLIPREPQTGETILWIDGVQLERGTQAHSFQRRSNIELGAEPLPRDGIAVEGEPIRVRVRTVNYPKVAWKGNLSVKVTDYFDREVFHEQRILTLGPQGRREELFELPESLGNGFFRFWYGLEGAWDRLHTLRLARIRRYEGQDSRFGLNHAYTYPQWQKRAGQVGVRWRRSWAYAWPIVEPEPGLWNFGAPDQLLAYGHRTGMQSLALLPNSSCNWSTTGPADAQPFAPPKYPLDRVGHKPASISHWRSYIEETARHLRNRVPVFEILNEPFQSEYALRPGAGYSMRDYAEMLRVAFRTLRRAAPESRVVGGLSAQPGERQLQSEFFATDAIHSLDLFSIHDYPPDAGARIVEPALEHLVKNLQEQAGRPVPIWLTDFGYFAEDDFNLPPDPRTSFHSVKDERRAADLTVQYNVIAAAYGVQKVFYHTKGGLSGIPNYDTGEEIFFEWNGAPRKVFAAQAALAEHLRPETTFYKRLDFGPTGNLPVYLFESPEGTAAFVWTDDNERAAFRKPSDQNVTFRNVVGNRIRDATITIDQSPVSISSQKKAPDFSAWFVETVSPSVRVWKVK